MPTFTPPSASAALVAEIQAHDTQAAAAWGAHTICAMKGDDYGARQKRAYAEFHDDMARIKREAIAKLAADRATETAA